MAIGHEVLPEIQKFVHYNLDNSSRPSRKQTAINPSRYVLLSTYPLRLLLALLVQTALRSRPRRLHKLFHTQQREMRPVSGNVLVRDLPRLLDQSQVMLVVVRVIPLGLWNKAMTRLCFRTVNGFANDVRSMTSATNAAIDHFPDLGMTAAKRPCSKYLFKVINRNLRACLRFFSHSRFSDLCQMEIKPFLQKGLE